MKYHFLFYLIFLIIVQQGFSQEISRKPEAAVIPVAYIGEISEAKRQIIFNVLQEKLTEYYSLISQKQFEDAQTTAFDTLDATQCTEENCIRKIQEILQVESLFALQIVEEEGFTQLSLTLITLDKKLVKNDLCEQCSVGQLQQRILKLVEKLVESSGDTQKSRAVISASSSPDAETNGDPLDPIVFSKENEGGIEFHFFSPKHEILSGSDINFLGVSRAQRVLHDGFQMTLIGANLVKEEAEGNQFVVVGANLSTHVTGWQLGIAGVNIADNVTGWQLGIAGVNIADNVTGWQLAIEGVNLVDHVQGWQLAGAGINIADQVDHWQLAGAGINIADQVDHWQLVGIGVNLSDQVGWQLSYGLNISDTVKSWQIGLINVADYVDGFQIGLINYTKQLKGFQIGFINIITQGTIPFLPIFNATF